MSKTTLPIAFITFASTALAGCASGGNTAMQNCVITYPLTVSPTTATLDHMAVGAANQVQFVGVAHASSAAGCPVPALARLEYASWANPDPTDIKISSAQDMTNGTATCSGATNGAVTLTGTFAPSTVSGSSTDTTVATVTVTCK